MKKNLIVGQSGGPTAAINATLAGVIHAGISSESVGTVFGAVNGIEGVLKENFIDLSEIFANEENLTILKQTPSAYLGSCRYKLSSEGTDIEKIIEVFKKHNIGYFCYIGGNDSMDTVFKLKDACKDADIKVIGIPKTIDNDLVGTDHCPGFGSAAKYIATTVSEITRDSMCYDLNSVTIIEIMGRNAGWLTAASALARFSEPQTPDLIYLPEVVFDTEKFLCEIKRLVEEKKNVVVAVSEGIKNSDGTYVAEQKRSMNNDLFGHSQLGGAGKMLETIIKERFGYKARSIELNTPQRCAAHISSGTDIEESFMIGAAGANAAISGESGKMMCYERKDSDIYSIDVVTRDISQIANEEKKVPKEFISESGTDVTKAFIDYAYPLIQRENPVVYKDGVPVHIFRK